MLSTFRPWNGHSQDFSKGGSHWAIQRVLTRLSLKYCRLYAYKKIYKGRGHRHSRPLPPSPALRLCPWTLDLFSWQHLVSFLSSTNMIYGDHTRMKIIRILLIPLWLLCLLNCARPLSLSDASNWLPHAKGKILEIILNKHRIHSQQRGAYYQSIIRKNFSRSIYSVLPWVVRKVHNTEISTR